MEENCHMVQAWTTGLLTGSELVKYSAEEIRAQVGSLVLTFLIFMSLAAVVFSATLATSPMFSFPQIDCIEIL